MKKASLLLAGCLMLCLLLGGCGSTADNVQEVQEGTVVQESTDPTENAAVTDSTAELAAPVLEWWELYNPNGFDTVTAAISNPNDVPIDVTYDFVYYKGGQEVARNEGFYNANILPGHKDLVWANYEIPKSTDADDVRMENVTVSKSYYEPIDGKYEYVTAADGSAFLDFTFERQPQLASIAILYYSDNNSNGHFDKGEIIGVGLASLMEQTGSVDVEGNANCEVFFTAY